MISDLGTIQVDQTILFPFFSDEILKLFAPFFFPFPECRTASVVSSEGRKCPMDSRCVFFRRKRAPCFTSPFFTPGIVEYSFPFLSASGVGRRPDFLGSPLPLAVFLQIRNGRNRSLTLLLLVPEKWRLPFFVTAKRAGSFFLGEQREPLYPFGPPPGAICTGHEDTPLPFPSLELHLPGVLPHVLVPSEYEKEMNQFFVSSRGSL